MNRELTYRKKIPTKLASRIYKKIASGIRRHIPQFKK